MGNSLTDQEKKTNTILYLESLEQVFFTEEGLIDIISRWTDLGKPLFLAPKDFKDKILSNMESEVKLNY